MRKAMKRAIKTIMILLMACFVTSCGSDEDEVTGEGLLGKWDLTEVLNGPVGMCKEGVSTKYKSGTVVIQIKENDCIEFSFDNGTKDTMALHLINSEELKSSLPVLTIAEVPFGYEVTSTRLKLHYYGTATCDHIPATFVFKRMR